MSRYEIRGTVASDEDALFTLARHLNTVNLPDNRDKMRELALQSEHSFNGEQRRTAEHRYVFLLWDREQQRAVGTSSLIAQLGRRDAPYIYFNVLSEERYSRTLDKHFDHTVLKLTFSYNGPTELGGLVVDPEYRSAPERLGRLISYVRFLFVAAHRERFREQLLAELLPPLEPDGTSHLWEALGRHFTGMSYREADLLSSENKEFIRDLFPTGGIYASLLGDAAQSVIGRVGAQTRGVEKMLKRVGFRYADRIDPFDGGPHFVADTGDVSLVKDTRALAYDPALTFAPGPSALVAVETAESPYFRAVSAASSQAHAESVGLPPATVEALGLETGSRVLYLPFA